MTETHLALTSPRTSTHDDVTPFLLLDITGSVVLEPSDGSLHLVLLMLLLSVMRLVRLLLERF